MEIHGTSALVTGAGSGIGRATAVLLAHRGAARIGLVDLNERGLAETADAVRAAGAAPSIFACDVADAAALTQVFAAFGADAPIDIVHNNAGVVSGAHMFPDAAPDRIARLFAINIDGVVIGTKLALAHMAGRRGVVVNTGSTAHDNAGFRDILYSTSKAAVVQFTRACGQLYPGTGVRVCAVNPTLVDTPIIDTTGGAQCADWMAPVLANNRALPPEAIAEQVLALIEDDTAVGRVVDATLDGWSGETRQLAGPGARDAVVAVQAMDLGGGR